MERNTITKIKAGILSLVIAIVLSAFVIYLIQSFHPNPQWDDYCDENFPRAKPIDPVNRETPVVEDQISCEEAGGTWRNNYCDYYYECQKEFDDASEKHRYVVFLVAVPAGLIAVAIGIFLGLPSVATGMMIGGVFLTIYGTSNYWDNFSNWIRVIILGVVLILLIWLGYKKLGS